MGEMNMLMQEATPEMLEAWKVTWKEYKDILLPNRKSGAEIVTYLSDKYLLTEIHDIQVLQVVAENVLNNEPLTEKLPVGTV